MGKLQRFILLLSLLTFTAVGLPSALYGQGNGGTMAPPDTTETTPPPDPPPDNGDKGNGGDDNGEGGTTMETTAPPDTTETTPPPQPPAGNGDDGDDGEDGGEDGDDTTMTTTPADSTVTTPPGDGDDGDGEDDGEDGTTPGTTTGSDTTTTPGTTGPDTPQQPCVSEGAVPNAASNPGLVSDCAALLEARDTLAGTATLNWSASTPIADWDGVTLGAAPQRVIQLRLQNKGLNGTIPASLGKLSKLEALFFTFNQLTGSIPAQLGDLTSLQHLGLLNNQLSGTIPPQLGSLTKLQELFLNDNQLTGAIPTELSELTRLTSLNLAGNQLSGCIPDGLGKVAINDLEKLNLPDCAQAETQKRSDFNGDGTVDFDDFFLLADAFNSSDARFDLDGDGTVDFDDFFLLADFFGQSTRAKLLALAVELIGLPHGPQLQQNAPNPFNSQTVLSYSLPEPGLARLEVFALTGQRVAVLHQGHHSAGIHRLHWDGRDHQGRPLASGIYLYRLVTAEGVLTRKLMLLR